MNIAIPSEAYRIVGQAPNWTPTFAARVAGRLTGIPVIVTICDENATGAYSPHTHLQAPWIEARGREGDPLLVYTLFHEVGHFMTMPGWSSMPAIYSEFLADRWVCAFYQGFIPDQAAWARRGANEHLRGICDVYHAAEPDPYREGPAVPEDVAAWCGWTAPHD